MDATSHNRGLRGVRRRDRKTAGQRPETRYVQSTRGGADRTGHRQSAAGRRHDPDRPTALGSGPATVRAGGRPAGASSSALRKRSWVAQPGWSTPTTTAPRRGSDSGPGVGGDRRARRARSQSGEHGASAAPARGAPEPARPARPSDVADRAGSAPARRRSRPPASAATRLTRRSLAVLDAGPRPRVGARAGSGAGGGHERLAGRQATPAGPRPRSGSSSENTSSSSSTGGAPAALGDHAGGRPGAGPGPATAARPGRRGSGPAGRRC